MKVELDPITTEELDSFISEEYKTLVESMRNGGVSFKELDKAVVAELFFSNGFLRGCLAMTENDDIKETISLVAEEINYQREQMKQ